MLMLDTHAVLWLYGAALNYFTPKGLKAIENLSLLHSPMVKLEIEYLFEIKRIAQPATIVLQELANSISLTEAKDGWAECVSLALEAKWTRDPFDRLICSHAQYLKLPLLSKDETILSAYPSAFW